MGWVRHASTIAAAASIGFLGATVSTSSSLAAPARHFRQAGNAAAGSDLAISQPANQAGAAGDAAQLSLRITDPAPGAMLKSVTAAGLPPGLNIGKNGTCVTAQDEICGFLTTPGAYHVTVTATDNLGATTSASFTWKVARAPGTGPVAHVHVGPRGKCLDDLGDSRANGAKVVIWTCDSRKGETWTVAQDGTLRIRGKCLDVAALRYRAPFRLWSCNGTAEENWIIGAEALLVETDTITHMWCVIDPRLNPANGTQAKIGSCGGPADRSPARVLSAGPLASGVPGKCLDDAGNSAANGTKVVIWTCDGGAAQRWSLMPDLTVRIHGKCLTAAKGSTANGAKITLQTCNDGARQQWDAEQIALTPGSRGQTVIAGMLVDQTASAWLADPSDSRANGTQVVLEHGDFGPGAYLAIR